MNEITLVIIDDHPLFRQGVADALSLEPDIKVVAQAADGEAGLELLRARKPNVAIVDVNLPGLNGQQITRQAVLEKLTTRIILLTACPTALTARGADKIHVGVMRHAPGDQSPAAQRFVVGMRQHAQQLQAIGHLFLPRIDRHCAGLPKSCVI